MSPQRFTLANLTLLVFVLLLTNTFSVIKAQTEQPFEQTLRVTALGPVNVRADASTQNSSIAHLRRGEIVTVLEQVPDGQSVSGNALWYHVQLDDGTQGFVWSGAVTQPVTVSTCVHPHTPSPDEVWIVDRQPAAMMRYDANSGRLLGGQSSDDLALWTTLVTVGELKLELGLMDQLQLEPLVDFGTCRAVGAVVSQGDFRYIAVREVPGGESIQFLVERYVSNVHLASDEDVASINSVMAAQDAEEENARILTQERQRLLLGEKITFVGVLPHTRSTTYPDGKRRIYILAPDGSNYSRLTDNPDGDWYEQDPAWSPSRRSVIYQHQNNLGNVTLAFYDLEADRQRRLPQDPYPFHNFLVLTASWSSDGGRLAVERITLGSSGQRGATDLGIMPSSINVVEVDSVSVLANIFPQGFRGTFRVTGYPTWSPRNNQIAFVAPNTDGNEYGVYIINDDGQELHRIGSGWDFAWSPDGNYLLVIDSDRSHALSRVTISLIDRDGNSISLLTPEPISVPPGSRPVWSPDGTQIALAATKEGTSVSTLYVLERGGTNWRSLTSDLDVQGVAWSPDGSQLAFVGKGAGKEALYVINADGSNQHMIVDDIDYYNDLTWLHSISP